MRKIAIFGPPRSGTSWLSHIFNSHPEVVLRFQPLFSYGHKDALSPTSSTEEIATFFNDILNSNDPFALMQTESQKAYPIFPKANQITHLVFKEVRYLNVVHNILESSPDVKIIGIIRNPLATLASWIKAPKEFHASWNIQDEWRAAPSKNQGRPEEYFGFNKWMEVAQSFMQFEIMYPDKFKLIKYNNLNTQPLKIVGDIFEFCDLKIHKQVQDFIISSQSKHEADPYSVYRSNANDKDWVNILPNNIVKSIKAELQNTPLKYFLEDIA